MDEMSEKEQWLQELQQEVARQEKEQRAREFKREIAGRMCGVSGCNQTVAVIVRTTNAHEMCCYLCRSQAKAGTLKRHPPMLDRSPAAEYGRALARALDSTRWKLPWWMR
jgi:hypothetical protein